MAKPTPAPAAKTPSKPAAKPAADGSPAQARTPKHKDPQVDAVLAKAERKETLTKQEMGALHSAGIRSDGSPRAPREVKSSTGLSTQKIIGVMQFSTDPEHTLRILDSKDHADFRMTCSRAIKQLREEAEEAADDASDEGKAKLTAMADKLASLRDLISPAGTFGGREAGDTYKVSGQNRITPNVSTIGAGPGDYVKITLIDIGDGTKGILITLKSKAGTAAAAADATLAVASDPEVLPAAIAA